MTRIHAIYCGGCREAYDRSSWLREIIQRLRTRLGEVELCYSPCPDATVRLVMFGCQAACHKPDPADLQPAAPVHRIAPNGMFDGNSLSDDEIVDQLAKEISGT